jgi:uncharacterized membrane protein
MKSGYKILIGLIVAGLLIRIINIGFQIMNNDELWTIAYSSPSLSVQQIIVQSLSTDCNPPLYYLLAHFSMSIFGETATAIRIPSLIFGVLLIPCMYLVGKEYKDELFGLLCAAFITFSYNFVFYAKYGRSYSMALVWVALAFYFFQRILKGDNRAGIWFGLFAILSVWTHLFTAIPLGCMVLYLLWKRLAFPGIVVFVIGSIPILNLVYVIATSRVITSAANDFGSSPYEILINTPFDLFAYSAVIIVPIIVYSLWTYRSELMVKIIAAISVVTWTVMIALSLRTQIIPHYLLFVVPMLLVPIVLPFWEAVTRKGTDMHFGYLLVVVVVLVLEFVQIWFITTIQRINM